MTTAPPTITADQILIVIPCYNHPDTISQLVSQIHGIHPHILIVDDGSEPPVEQILSPPSPQTRILRHRVNRGKGAAIISAADFAHQHGYHNIITIDADGQHLPQDLPAFISATLEQPCAIHIGVRDFSAPNIPGSSRFGRGFSNFWARLQTGIDFRDMQSGYRSYPVPVIRALPCFTRSYAFEVEILVRAAWAHVQINHIPIQVIYQPPEKRVSHFRKFRHNLILTLLNTHLTGRSITPWPHRKLPPPYGKIEPPRVSILHPLHSIKLLLTEHISPRQLALASATGIIIGSLPIFGLHTVAIVFAANYLRVNKPAAIAASQLCMPPILPALCIELGHFLTHGTWLTTFNLQTLAYEAHYRLLEWFLGSLFIGPLFAFVCATAVRITAHRIQQKLRLDPNP